MSEPATYTVDTFCGAHNISRSHFYDLVREGLGPRLMRRTGRTIISGEAAADWRREMEEQTSAKEATP